MIGAALGPYRIETELGSGGMGKVFAAVVEGRCPGLEEGTRVALKVVHPHLLEQPGFFRRFLREAEIGASVRHPNVVRTHLADAIGHEHFLVMEYVEGQTLRELLDELERVPEELCRHIGREVAKGLAAIHDAGVVHRDIKPENVLITADHVVKVMDLGVARLQGEAVRLSQTGAFVGSIHYAAPEQFDVETKPDHRVDLYALGLLLYELGSGSHPYYDEDYRVILKRLLNEEPRRIHEINPQLSPFYEELVHTLLAKDREDRFPSAAEVLLVLEEGESGMWWTDRTRALRVQTRRPLRRIRIPRETAIYGRDEELTRLRALYDQAKSGDGQVVLIEGEAGIGKSRLVDELVGRLQQDGEDINFLFGSYPPSGTAMAEGAFPTAYRAQFGDAGAGQYLTESPMLVPAFDALLRGEPPPSGVLELTKDSLGTCFVHATRALAAERPTVVLIDDLHFAPDVARGLFTALALAVPDHRLLLIGTTRPGVPEDWTSNLTRPVHVAHLHVGRLGPKDLALLLRESFRSERLADQLGHRIALKSDGNPFFAFEIIRGLREGQFITQQPDGTWVSTQVIDKIQIPSSVLDLVNARVAGLSEEDRDLLDVASCLGFEFDPALLAVATGAARIPLFKRLAHIERAHRLVRSAGREFVFDHHQVQEALYASLPEVLREEYHAALADALAALTNAGETDPDALDGALCVDLCEHYLKGARGEAALRYLPAAHESLQAGYLHAKSAELAERALAVPGLLNGVERARTLLRLAGHDGPLAMLAWHTRRETAAREAERLAGEEDDDELRGQAASALGDALYRMSRFEEAEAAQRRSLKLAQACGDRGAESTASGSLGLICQAHGRLDDARGHHERSLALCRETGRVQGEAVAEGNLGSVYMFQGRLDAAREHCRRSLALSRETGHRANEALATTNLGNITCSQGRLAEACEHLQRALVLCRETGHRHGEANAATNLGYLLAQQGDLAEARESLDLALSLSLEIGDRRMEAYALSGLGVVSYEEGDEPRAEERLRASLAISTEVGLRHILAQTHLALGSLRTTASGENGRRQALEVASAHAREAGISGVEALARCKLALLPDGDAQDALAAFTEHGGQLTAEELREARYLLWKATGDRVHLEEAKRLLDELAAQAGNDTSTSMLTNVRVNREIVAAWEEHGRRS